MRRTQRGYLIPAYSPGRQAEIEAYERAVNTRMSRGGPAGPPTERIKVLNRTPFYRNVNSGYGFSGLSGLGSNEMAGAPGTYGGFIDTGCGCGGSNTSAAFAGPVVEVVKSYPVLAVLGAFLLGYLAKGRIK